MIGIGAVSFSVERRFVWYRVAKTGTRTLNAVLRERVPDYRYLDPRDTPPRELVRLLQGSAFTFAVVRDPWDRLASAWSDKLRARARPHARPEVTARQLERRLRQLDVHDDADRRAVREDFRAFVRRLPASALVHEDRHFLPQSRILGRSDPQRVVRFERLEIGLREVLREVGVDLGDDPLPQRNRKARRKRDLSTWYDEETSGIVAELYADDAQRWSFAPPELVPPSPTSNPSDPGSACG